MSLPTYDELERDYQSGLATLPVDKINHREFVRDGIRYFCGWSSAKKSTNDVQGWLVYKSKRERQ